MTQEPVVPLMILDMGTDESVRKANGQADHNLTGYSRLSIQYSKMGGAYIDLEAFKYWCQTSDNEAKQALNTGNTLGSS